MTQTTEIQRRRTFAIISHPDAGKTTITEKFLLHGGAIQIAGEVKARKAARHATSDWMALEKERGISVTTSVMQFPYQGRILNLLDTPGHADFSEDTYRTLSAVDSTLMVIDGSKGVETRTIKLMEICRRRAMPTWTFINKLDRDVLPPVEVMDEIEETLGIHCAPLNWPLDMGRHFKGLYQLHTDRIHVYAGGHGSELWQPRVIAGFDSAEARALLGNNWQDLRDEIELVRCAGHTFDPQACLEGRLTPVFFGTALGNFGIRQLLDHFVQHAPAPRARVAKERKVAETEKNFSGFVFKIQANMDPRHRDRLAFVRICAGKYEPGMKIFHVRTGKTLKIGDAVTFMAGARTSASEALPGDIIGLHYSGDVRIGDAYTLGENLRFLGIPSFAPEIFRKVRLTNPWKSKQLVKGLRELTEEGAIQFFRPVHNNDLILGAVGALQFDIVAYRLRVEYGVSCEYDPCSIHSASWVLGEDPTQLEEFRHRHKERIAHDHADRLIYLATGRVNLQLTEERWPELRFLDVHEN